MQDELYMCVIEDEDGNEVLMQLGQSRPLHVRGVPVMASDRENFRNFWIPLANQFSERFGVPYRALKFTNAEDVTAEFRSQVEGDTP